MKVCDACLLPAILEYEKLKLFLVPLLDSLEFGWQVSRYAMIFVSAFFRQRTSLACEMVAIRSQLTFYNENIRQKRQPRPPFHPAFRLLWVLLSKVWSGWQSATKLMKPKTVVKWHEHAFLQWRRWKSRRKGGRPAISQEMRALIRREIAARIRKNDCFLLERKTSFEESSLIHCCSDCLGTTAMKTKNRVRAYNERSLHATGICKGWRNTVAKKGLREQLIGAWKLVSYVESPDDGSPKRFPMGENARGIIMYAPDGYISSTPASITSGQHG